MLLLLLLLIVMLLLMFMLLLLFMRSQSPHALLLMQQCRAIATWSLPALHHTRRHMVMPAQEVNVKLIPKLITRQRP